MLDEFGLQEGIFYTIRISRELSRYSVLEDEEAEQSESDDSEESEASEEEEEEEEEEDRAFDDSAAEAEQEIEGDFEYVSTSVPFS